MSDDTLIPLSATLGHCEVRDLPHRFEGNDLITRHVYLSYDHHGNVTRRREFDGPRIVNGRQFLHLFPNPPPSHDCCQEKK